MKEFFVDYEIDNYLMYIYDDYSKEKITNNETIVMCSQCKALIKKSNWQFHKKCPCCGNAKTGDIDLYKIKNHKVDKSRWNTNPTQRSWSYISESKSNNANYAGSGSNSSAGSQGFTVTSSTKDLDLARKKTIIISLILIVIISSIVLGLSILFVNSSKKMANNNNISSNASSLLAPDASENEKEDTTDLEDEQNKLTVINAPVMESKTTKVSPARVVTRQGSIDSDDDVDTYTISAVRSGIYRIDFSEIYSGTYFDADVYDRLGDRVAGSNYISNETGFTAELKANEEYKVKVSQNSEYGSYTIKIYDQKKTLDISNYTSISDSIDFTDQINNYKFKAPVSGNYRFDFSEIYSGTYVDICIKNYLGETVANSNYIANDDGVTAELEAGKAYTIAIEQNTETSSYKMSIGYPHEALSSSANSVIHDSVLFRDAENTYNVTISDGQTHSVIVTGLDNTIVSITAYNQYGEKLDSDTWCGNDEGIEISQSCTVVVTQTDGLSNYRLTIS